MGVVRTLPRFPWGWCTHALAAVSTDCKGFTAALCSRELPLAKQKWEFPYPSLGTARGQWLTDLGYKRPDPPTCLTLTTTLQCTSVSGLPHGTRWKLVSRLNNFLALLSFLTYTASLTPLLLRGYPINKSLKRILISGSVCREPNLRHIYEAGDIRQAWNHL